MDSTMDFLIWIGKIEFYKNWILLFDNKYKCIVYS
jgi:hypothetical protein